MVGAGRPRGYGCSAAGEETAPKLAHLVRGFVVQNQFFRLRQLLGPQAVIGVKVSFDARGEPQIAGHQVRAC
eukprot:332853-Prorocentrum_minimum.AAC.1